MTINSLLYDKQTTYSKSQQEQIVHLASQTFFMYPNFEFDIIIVNKAYIARPDKISYDNYGDSKYGDLICKINGISNPFELNADDILIIPKFEYLDKFFVKDTFDDTIENEKDNTTTPYSRPKSKKSKRKANEAVAGDNRFVIDTSRRVIVY